ncbi:MULTISPECIES: hypothetical protein [Rhodococcus]|uniref:Hypothetical membrane protein n=1 Tax=Rhodococcus erythropolis (strain PR4 / NBRC 100887) TaxID=234621 RepID=Q3L8Z1_RHOE4|nr:MULTISPECIES: hypothetical protein [Rhodococcus]BAE46322.1 hypothetical membrane protein [Rhodococcus erythropolis PR4]
MPISTVAATVLLFLGAGALALRQVLLAKLLWVLAAVAVIALAVNGIQARNIIAICAAVVILGAIAVILFVIPNKSERS